MLTKETSLRIVKLAEEQYDPENRHGLTRLVGWITGSHYKKDRDHDENRNTWQEYNEAASSTTHRSSEEMSEILTRQVNDVVELLTLVHDQEKKLHDVIVAYRALKADIKKHTE